jgi:DNA polymerase III subunit delta
MAKQLSEYKPVYLIYGEQDLLLERALEQLKRSVGELADLDFNSETFEGENANADEIVAACNTLPFASERRLVVVRNVDKMAKDGTDALVKYAENPAETTILALVAKKLAKNTRLYKLIEKLGGLIERTAPRPSEYPREVQGLFSRKGKSVTLEGAELMVNAVGRDLRRLSVEVDKAIAYTGDKTELTADDVAQVVSTAATTRVFELGTALGDRDSVRALTLLDLLLGDGESVYGLHALALRQIRDLIAARALIDRGGGSAGELAATLGRPDWQVKSLPRQARGFTSDELVEVLRAAAEGEAEMKTSRDPRLVFERWIVRVCG